MASGLCVCFPRIWPIKQVLAKFAPEEAIQITPLTVVMSSPEPLPKARLLLPVALKLSVPAPMAVLLSAVLRSSAPAPTAVLKLPAVLEKSEKKPTAVLAEPVVRLKRALAPSAVVKFG